MFLGDEALPQPKSLGAGLRPAISLARYGGEEMIVILPNTAKESAIDCGERLCERIQNTKVFQNDAISYRILPRPLAHA